MVTKSQIKLITSLKQKKYRNRHGLFVVEGQKIVTELLRSGIKCYQIFVDDAQKTTAFVTATEVSSSQMKQMSSLNVPNGVLGVFYMPQDKDKPLTDWVLALDAVRDPGNLGTIIRLCDWFGISELRCSEDTVDCYNPKVVQATMGSIARIHIHYSNLHDYLKAATIPVYGACMSGERVYDATLPEKGILVMGSEAHGLSNPVQALVTKHIAIPQFGTPTAESLNVATAAAILLSEIRR